MRLAESREARRVVVIGAGIVGICIGYALVKRGLDVTLIDRDEPGRGCSYGNSGAISESSVSPLAMPGVLASVPAMLRDPESPLHVKWSSLPRVLPWLVRFVSASHPAQVAASAAKLAALHSGAIGRHVALARELGVPELVVQRGHLHVYPDAKALAKDAPSWRMRREYGFAFEEMDREGILALEPGIGPRYTVGVYLADHATIVNPLRYSQAIVRAFVAGGGSLERDTVQSLSPSAGGEWRIRGASKRWSAAHVVVAAGAWSRRLLGPLGVHLALESQRGYHVQFRGVCPVTRTVVLADRKIFATPMEEGLRLGGTVEFAGLDAPPDPRRAEIIARIGRETFAGLGGAESSTWMGHRPCMPGSVPVVGQAAAMPGLWLAVGHGHLGLTDSVNTAERIADALTSEMPRNSTPDAHTAAVG